MGAVDGAAATERFDRRFVLRGVAGAAAGGLVATALGGRADAAEAARLEAYADLTSVAPGSTIRFFVDNGLAQGVASGAAMTIVRVDHPSDVTVHSTSVTVRGQITPPNAWATGCGWVTTTSFAVPAGWPSGLYQAIFTEGAARGVVSFVVKPVVAAAQGSILCQVPFTTLQAYNEWGGKCLYEFRSSDRVRSARVSFDRPHANPEWGDLHQWVRPFVRYARRRGVPIDYVSSVDLHAEPHLLDPYQLFVTVGHDEYWSHEMRSSLDRFVGEGGNAAILSGNSMYWQIRFEPSPAGDANRVITCYKDFDADPVADVSRKTVEWEEFGPRYKHALGTNSQHASIGLGFERGGVWSSGAARPDTPFVIHRPEHWALANTGVAAGSRIAGDVVGYETDSLEWTLVDGRAQPTGADGAPSNFMILGIADLTAWAGLGQRGGEAIMGLFRNNGTVFNAGTVDWCKALTGPSSVVERITTNVLDALAAPKSLTHRHLRQLYQYHAVNGDGGWRFVFTASPFFTQPNTGWTYDGPRFWVFDGPVELPGVVAVQQYHATNPDGGWNISYRLEDDPAPEGWTHDGVAFHAYSAPGADRIAIYEHSAPTAGGVPRVVYTESEHLGLGWTLERVSFYAPRPPETLNEV